MRKEALLSKKKEAVKDLLWYVKQTMTDDELKQFSISQLHVLCNVLQKAEEYRESCSPFYTLSANEVLQKSTGKIACFEEAGTIREESEDEILSGATSSIYKNYIKKKEQ